MKCKPNQTPLRVFTGIRATSQVCEDDWFAKKGNSALIHPHRPNDFPSLFVFLSIVRVCVSAGNYSTITKCEKNLRTKCVEMHKGVNGPHLDYNRLTKGACNRCLKKLATAIRRAIRVNVRGQRPNRFGDPEKGSFGHQKRLGVTIRLHLINYNRFLAYTTHSNMSKSWAN